MRKKQAIENTGKTQENLPLPVNEMTLNLGVLGSAVHLRLHTLKEQHINERIWDKDATLWKSDPESQASIPAALGWLDIIPLMVSAVPDILKFVQEVRDTGFTHVLHIGMGGSSLASLLFKHTFEPGKNGLKLSVIDTTDTVTIKAIERSIPLERTLFIVASKSGTTAETKAISNYFYNKLKSAIGDSAGTHFVAITDPHTPLFDKAKTLHYRHIFLDFEDIGSCYSALSYFGIVPAALLGLDVGELLERALKMQRSCASHHIPSENPALTLGAVIGELALQQRNKLTLILSDSLSSFGMLLEQLVAESTGKEGKGILPVIGESLLSPPDCRNDRLFVYLHLKGEDDPGITEKLNILKAAGHPLVTIVVASKIDLAQEIYRWEMAVAVAGVIIGINPFNHPNVRESREHTDRLINKLEREGVLPRMTPAVTEGKLTFFTYRNKFQNAVDLLDTFLNGEHGVEYLAIQAFLAEDPRTDQLLIKIRTMLQHRLKIAITLGYAPRLLHSTGQYHKGGPNNGIFLQLTADEKEVIAVPGKTYSFGDFIHAQADGDYKAMLDHSRRIIRVDLNSDVHQGLAKLIGLISQAHD